jgi:hypothetical protein
MIGDLRDRLRAGRLWIWGIAALVLLGSGLFGSRPSLQWLVLPLVGIGAYALLQQPILGPAAVVAVALLLRLEIGTGTEVALNPATLLVPALLALWLLDMMLRRDVHLIPSPANRPLLLFLLAGLISLLVGNALWDPAVPREGDFVLVQLAQWAIFAFSAGAFWLTGNLITDQAHLRRLTFFFLALGGSLAVMRVTPGGGVVGRVSTAALGRAPFWMLLAALAGGQLLFNEELSAGWKWFLAAILAAVGVYALFLMRAAASNWVGVVAVAGVLAWLRWPRLRWPALALLVIPAISGALSSTLYSFAGGDAEWAESGGSRLALIGRVIEVTMRNPITGLGPAAYRRYAALEPLSYGKALWFTPGISSHNNYVDLFSHVGLLGLSLFLWFAVELAMLGLRLRSGFTRGFAAGYVNAMLALWAGSLLVMLLLDWILPFVHNVGFPGFQASVLVWLFLGGLVSLEAMTRHELSEEDNHAT